MITIDDFKDNHKSKSAQKTINEFNATIYFLQTTDGKFNISGRCIGFKQPKYICRVTSIDECNSIYLEICEKLTFLSKFQDSIDMENFFEELHKQHTPSERQKRLKETSEDGIITVYVKKEYDQFVPRVIDYQKGTTNYRKGHITPATPIEKEAEESCLRVLNEYNIYGEYSRKLDKRSYIFEHEKIKGEPTENECYLYDNGVKTEMSQEQLEKVKIMIENDLI